LSDLERYGVRRTIGEILDYVRRSMVLDVLPGW
jgi:DNA-directed RNA polymerase specialized sigma subunit